jgi:signal transduction histidine kinase
LDSRIRAAMKSTKTLLTIFTAIIIILLFANAYWDYQVKRDNYRNLIESNVAQIASILASSSQYLEPEYFDVSQVQRDSIQFAELQSLNDSWNDNLLNSRAEYLQWQNQSLRPLKDVINKEWIEDDRVAAKLNRYATFDLPQYKFYMAYPPVIAYAKKNQRGYLIKLVHNREFQSIEERLENFRSFLRELMEQPLIKYVIVQSPQKIVFNFPIPLPAETRLAFPETAMTEIMDRYIEGRAALPDDNHILRIGYSKSWLAQANQQLITDLSINTIIGLTIIFLVFLWVYSQKKAEQSERKANFANILSSQVLQNMGDIVVVFQEDGTVSLSNPNARSFFDTTEDRILATCELLIANFANAFRSKTFFSNERVGLRDQQYSFSGKPFLTPENQTYFLLLGKDITYEEQIAQRQKLEERIQAMNVLASGVAHEIRNPLNAVSMIHQRIQGEYPPAASDDEYHQLSETLTSEVSRMNTLIDQFLALSKPLKINLETFQIRELIDELVLMSEAFIGAKDIRIDIELLPEDFQVYNDANLLKQIMINFTKNAAEAISDGHSGVIKIFAMNDEKLFSIGVKDNGSGMTEEQLQQIANPFYTTKAAGTGLGLAVVQKIATQLNGEMIVNSSPGKGSEFKIRFIYE